MNWSSLAQPIILARGWRSALVAFAAGAASTLALAPFNAWPAMLVTFPLLVWLIDGASTARWGGAGAAFATGWWFGFGYFLAGLYWIGYAFLVDAKSFGWLLPIAVTALPAGLAVFTGLGIALARVLWSAGALRILTLAAALSAAEWLRGHVLTGFPWNVYGYALTTPLPLAQGVALVGIWGLTFIAVAVFASPAALANRGSRPWLPVLYSAVTLAVLAVYGTVRLALNPLVFVDDVRLRIVQPNVPQDEKFNYGARRQIMERYITLSERAGDAGGDAARAAPRTAPSATAEGVGSEAGNGPGALSPASANATYVIWPESAFPFFLTREPTALAAIAEMLSPRRILITGAASPAEPVPGRGLRAYNSAYVIDRTGTILESYDKLHLVPFGEFLPFQDALERLGMTQLTKVQGGFLPGDRRRKMALPGAPDVLILICYEIIFPGEAVPRGERPGWLLNLTNDAWFGISSGPYQHFQQARVRAIEEGLPLVRAANDGISAVVDPVGRIIASLPLGSEGVIDVGLPRATDVTLYARIGDILYAMVAGVTLFIGLIARLRA